MVGRPGVMVENAADEVYGCQLPSGRGEGL